MALAFASDNLRGDVTFFVSVSDSADPKDERTDCLLNFYIHCLKGPKYISL